ncbi:MAG: hypothetical protein A4S08_07660 [Proteobacteria bacterium SG_bin4]|nr:MAG: hypothetical protein A4S08_07660 [Proteobacteria bacterium SG_bin4]
MKIFQAVKPLLLLFIAILTLTACNRISPVQHHYNTKVGCIVANDFYAVYFSTYVEPDKMSDDSTKVNESLFKSHCINIPYTGNVYFTADLVDEDLRETPISLRLVEQELTGKNKDSSADYEDVRIISEVMPKIYSQGTIETHAVIDKIGHYALYLIIGDEKSALEDDILKIRFNVGLGTETTSFWRYVAKAAELFMTFAFPALLLLLIMSPMLPKLRLIVLSKMLFGMLNRRN